MVPLEDYAGKQLSIEVDGDPLPSGPKKNDGPEDFAREFCKEFEGRSVSTIEGGVGEPTVAPGQVEDWFKRCRDSFESSRKTGDSSW